VNDKFNFFRLSNYQDRLLKFYEDNPFFVTPSNRLAEVVSFVKNGLKDLSISRTTVKWGIPFPQDPKHTIYVWGDALTNYISAIGYGSKNQADGLLFEKFWPANVHVMAKDILRFHAIYWPAFLMAAGLPLPQKLLVHGYILVGDQKMSKSLGNAIDPDELYNQFGQEAVRYYLTKQMVVTQDGSFDLNELQNCYNADLANNFGNLINRVLTLACKNGLEIIKPINNFNDLQCNDLIDLASKTAVNFCKQMDEYSASTAIQLIMNLCSATNSLVHQKEPWKIVKSNYELFTEVISASAQTLNLCAHLLKSFIPTKAIVVLQALGSKINQHKAITCVENTFWQETLSLTIPVEPIFPRFEVVKKPEPALSPEVEKYIPAPNVDYITFEDLQKVKLSVGQIMLAEPVKGSSKLLRLEVDFGELGKRQVVSGIAEYYKPESLIFKKAIFVVNLEPRKIMGLESQAMILAAKDGTNFSITLLENDLVVPGAILS
jgi:methionyl-tRNA synthetase